MSFSSFFKNSNPNLKPLLPLSVQDLEGDLLEIIFQNEDFVIVDKEDGFENPKDPNVIEHAPEETALEPAVDKPLVHSAKPNPRKERWERQYRKVFATVTDAQGEVFEVRHVNQNRQLAFWDCHHNTQIYVYPRKNSDKLETKEKAVLTIVR